MGSSHCQLRIAAPAWTAAGALSSGRAVSAGLRPAPRRDGGLPVALLASAAAHAFTAATLGTAWLSETPAPRGDGNPVHAVVMSVTVTAPPAPVLPRVAPPPDPQLKPPAPFEPPATIAPRVIATRAKVSAPLAFTVPPPKPVLVANAPLLPVADSTPAEPAASVGGDAGRFATHVGAVGAGAGPTNGVVQTVALVRARPDYAHSPPPPYPETARLRGWQGTVVLAVDVQPDGSAREIGIVKSSGHRTLDEASVEAVRGWRFHPARIGETPVPSRVEVPISFRLKNG
jgi:protein TonB